MTVRRPLVCPVVALSYPLQNVTMVASVAAMRTLRLGALAALLVALVPAQARAEQTAPEDGMGCPQGFVAFDAQTGQGGPPSYEPGSEAVASGYLTDATTKAAPSVTLRWGTPDGEALGTAALDREGNFQGLRFTIPADRPTGVFTLYLEAFGADGQMLPGLPIPVQLRVGAPPVADPAPADVTEVAPVRAQRRSVSRRPASPAKTPTARTVAARETSAPPVETAPKVTATRPAAKPSTARSRARDRKPAPAPLRTGGPRPRPRPLAAPADAPVAAPALSDRARRQVGLAEPADAWLLALVLGALGTGLAAVRRRRAALAPPLAQVAAPVERDLLIEAELQELIAEERAARRTADENVLV